MQTILDCRLTWSEIDFFISSGGSRRDKFLPHRWAGYIYDKSIHNFPNQGAKTFSFILKWINEDKRDCDDLEISASVVKYSNSMFELRNNLRLQLWRSIFELLSNLKL